MLGSEHSVNEDSSFDYRSSSQMVVVYIDWRSVPVAGRTEATVAEVISRTNHSRSSSCRNVNQPILNRRNELIEFGLIYGLKPATL